MKICKILLLVLVTTYSLTGQEGTSNSIISIAEITVLESSILGETRELYIYTPQGLWGMDESMTDLPVIYVLDGESQFNHTVATVDFLSIATNGNDFIPRSIVVGVPNTNRVRDLTPVKDTDFDMSGGGARFLDFITEELIPYIDSTFNTSDHRTIIGHSFGGTMVFEALLRKREYFDHYLAFDPGFGLARESFLHEVIDSLEQVDLSKEKVFCSIANNRPSSVTEESLHSDRSRFIKSFWIPQQKFIEYYHKGEWEVDMITRYYADENHYSIPHRSTYEGLRELYKYYTFPEMTNYYHPHYNSKRDLVLKIREHYENISNIMGYEVVPMQGYINSFAFGLSHFDREDLAIDLLKYNIELHPEDPLMYTNLAYYYMSNGYNREALELYRKSLTLKDDDWVSNTMSDLKRKILKEEGQD